MDRIKLSTKNVSIEFPGVKALEDINFEVSTGEIRAVVGANGAGKSTLMKVCKKMRCSDSLSGSRYSTVSKPYRS